MTGPRFQVPAQLSRSAAPDDALPTSRTERPPVPAAAPPPDEVAPRPASVVADLPVDVVCPGCGTTAVVDGVRRDAHDFCVSCDYPLFWAVPRRTALPTEILGDTGLRRLPGTAGHAALAALRCPACTEPNPPAAVLCARCGSELRAVAVALPPPADEPEPEPPVVVPVPWWQQDWVAWLVGLSALLVLVLGIVTLVV